MSDFLTMRSFPEKKEPTLAKVRRDGENMYREARHVFVLDKEGNIIETINRPTKYTGNFLVVLAPVIYKDELVPLSVVLEIGISRSVPYKTFEKWIDGKKFSIKDRISVAKLTSRKIISLLPVISEELQKIVDEDTSHRKNLVWKKYGKDKKEMPIGIFITIPQEETILTYVCLEKDFIERSNGHLQLFVDMTRSKLSRLKFAYYPKGQIKRLKQAKDVASVLYEADYPHHFFEIIRKKLGRRTSKVRSLFEQIIEEFKIKIKEKDEIDSLHEKLDNVYSKIKEPLLNLFKISIQTHPKRNEKRSIHAKNCLRVEIHPSETAILAKHFVS